MTRQILPIPHPITSYWLKDQSPLADLRSTPGLPRECDVAIVGAGMAGVLTAYHILKSAERSGDPRASNNAQEGLQSETGGGPTVLRPTVLLIDGRQLCSGATGRNGGHVKVQVATLLNLPGSATDGGRRRTAFQKYVASVVAEIKRVVDEERLDCEFELRRSFDVFTDAAQATTMFERFDAARSSGEVWTRDVCWVGSESVESITSIRGAKGAFSVPAASFWPYKFVTGLLERMVQRWPGRLNVQMNTPVTCLNPTPSGASLLATERGELTALKVVLATNAYTAGLEPCFKDKIVPVRGMASHHTPQQQVHPHLSNTYNINSGPSAGVDYLNPRPDGGIVVGGGAWLFAQDEASWKANWDDAHLFPPAVMGYWRSYMQTRFLGWEDSGSVNDSTWTGIMGRTGDGQPFVGRVSGRRNVWVLGGFNGGGMALIAVCARAVGRMAVEAKGFGEVWREEGLLEAFECSERRLKRL